MGYYGGVGPYTPNNYGFNLFDENNNPVGTSAVPYVEADKSARTTAIFQGIAGVINSAGDFYQRIKFNPQPVAGRDGDPNVYWGGGVSYKPGESGEPTKLSFSGVGGISPIMLILIVVALFFLLRK